MQDTPMGRTQSNVFYVYTHRVTLQSFKQCETTHVRLDSWQKCFFFLACNVIKKGHKSTYFYVVVWVANISKFFLSAVVAYTLDYLVASLGVFTYLVLFLWHATRSGTKYRPPLQVATCRKCKLSHVYLLTTICPDTKWEQIFWNGIYLIAIHGIMEIWRNERLRESQANVAIFWGAFGTDRIKCYSASWRT